MVTPMHLEDLLEIKRTPRAPKRCRRWPFRHHWAGRRSVFSDGESVWEPCSCCPARRYVGLDSGD